MRTRYFLISIAQARRIIRPLIMYSMFCDTERKVRPVNIIWSSSTPTTIPLIFPVPPTKETPPMTHAAMASLS